MAWTWVTAVLLEARWPGIAHGQGHPKPAQKAVVGEEGRSGGLVQRGSQLPFSRTDLSHGFPLRQSWLHNALWASSFTLDPQAAAALLALQISNDLFQNSLFPTCYIYTSPLEFLKLQSRCLSTAMQQKQPVGQRSPTISSSTTVRENKVSGLFNGTWGFLKNHIWIHIFR